MKHTPGPWAFNLNHHGEFCLNGKPISPLDSRVMSVAPEMLDELEFLISNCIEKRTRQYADGSDYEVEIIKVYESGVARIRKLIAKARGLK